jgi:hypothetical protein
VQFLLGCLRLLSLRLTVGSGNGRSCESAGSQLRRFFKKVPACCHTPPSNWQEVNTSGRLITIWVGDFEPLIERHGFPLTRMEPCLTAEKIEHIAKVDRGEKFTPAFTDAEMIQRVENEAVALKRLASVAVVTGSYPSIPVTCRVLDIPLVWVVQSTWFPDFFERGAGMTDRVRPAAIKAVADRCILAFINFWIKHGFLNSVNHAAKRFGVPGYDSIFDYWRGDITLVADPPEFSGVKLPPKHFFIGPLIPHDEFPMPEEIRNIPRDKPLIYFAMGSSGTRGIVARIIESFEGKPYRVIAPVKFNFLKLRTCTSR